MTMIDGWIKLRRRLPVPAGMNDAERAAWEAQNDEHWQCLWVPTLAFTDETSVGTSDGGCQSWQRAHPEALVWFPDDSDRGGTLYEWMAKEGVWKEVLDDTLEVVTP